MDFEWDEAKSEACFVQRGFDFAYGVFVVVYTTRTHALRSCSAQERRTVASGKNRVSGESGKAMKP